MINKLIYSFVVILSVGLVFYSCTKDDNPVVPLNNDPVIYGKVVDEEGNPVPGVNVHYVPLLTDTSFEKISNNPLATVTINFSLPNETYVTIVFLEHITRDTLFYPVENQLLNAGNYAIHIDISSMTNGIYDYVIKFDSTIIERELLLNRDPQELVAAHPLTTTDGNGDFELRYDRLGIGETFGITSEVSPEIIFYVTISDSMQIFLTKQNYNNCLEPIKIDTNFAFRKTFTLTK